MLAPESSWTCQWTGPAPEHAISAAEKELGVAFPDSYRLFLRRYGAGKIGPFELYGLPVFQVWGDVVMMTQLSSIRIPDGYVKVTDSFGDCGCYLDTSVRERGECSVIAIGSDGVEVVVAGTFAEFLQKILSHLKG